MPQEGRELGSGEDAFELWSALQVTQQLTLLEYFADRVLILPRKTSGRGFEPELVVIDWHDFQAH